MLTILILSTYWINRMTSPLNRLLNAIKEITKGNLGSTVSLVPNNELGLLIEHFNRMSIDILNLVERNKIIEKKKRDLEIEALQNQINPHFLYNTLNTIKWMAAAMNVSSIADSITILGRILKPIFQNHDALWEISEEIEYLENYVKIMKLRYGEDFRIAIDTDENLLKCKIQRLILQPLIENSIMHGLKDRTKDGIITIQLIDQEGSLQIIISDNGQGISAQDVYKLNKELSEFVIDEPIFTKAIGLRNVNRRIKLHFGHMYGLRIESQQNAGTKIFVLLPKVMA
jgi:two-component system, sensor histidine kinase YesM